jgi:hypothetical protein
MTRTVASLVLSATLALAALGTALAAPGGGRASEEPAVQLAAANGTVAITNSREGTAVLEASGLRPGAGVNGTVRIGNAGRVAGRFALEPSGISAAPGPSGGRLSDLLELVVFDITDVNRPVTKYAGRINDMPRVPIGTLAAGERRNYLFAVTLTAGGNSYQGASAAIGFRWLAEPLVTATPTPTPTPRPEPAKPNPTPAPAAPTPAPATPTTPTTPPATDDGLGLPSTRACVSRRSFKIRLRPPRALGAKSATVFVNGRRKATVKGRKLRVPVNLRGLPAGKVTVKVVIKGKGGKTATATRKYRTCAKKR